ncbi:MAG TPA: TlpA disulfide reductase family protein [Gemmatimonadaceae bacterium]
MSKKKRNRPVAAAAPERKRRWWLRATTLVWLAPMVVVAARFWVEPSSSANGSVATADAPAAPPFRVTTLDGRTVSDDQLRGKVVLVNFWATWCPPCQAEMPGFEAVYERHADSDFVVLGVAMDAGGAENVQRFLAERRIRYPVAMANGSMVEAFGGVSLLPNSFLVDRQGRIRNEVRGAYDAATLDRQVGELLREPRTVAGTE